MRMSPDQPRLSSTCTPTQSALQNLVVPPTRVQYSTSNTSIVLRACINRALFTYTPFPMDSSAHFKSPPPVAHAQCVRRVDNLNREQQTQAYLCAHCLCPPPNNRVHPSTQGMRLIKSHPLIVPCVASHAQTRTRTHTNQFKMTVTVLWKCVLLLLWAGRMWL
jgi:hypothetical protein